MCYNPLNMFSRREFFSGSAAFAVSVALAKGRTDPKLRVGVLSDIHITTDEDVPAFEKALRYFDTRKVDAVLISGDLTRWNWIREFELVTGDVVKTACERCVFSEGVFQAEEEETKPVVCAFNRKDIPSTINSRQKIRFVVTPRSCWGVEGEPIATSWMSLGAIGGGAEACTIW